MCLATEAKRTKNNIIAPSSFLEDGGWYPSLTTGLSKILPGLKELPKLKIKLDVPGHVPAIHAICQGRLGRVLQ